MVAAAARLVACNDPAQAAGLVPGMGLAAARAIAPQLVVTQRDPRREVAALEALACVCGRFTPRIALVPPQALLLEIGGCLRLFGSLGQLLAAVRTDIAAQGFSAHSAVAPTPQGALWLALAGGGTPVSRDAEGLRQALDALSLARLDLPPPVQQRLAGFGLRTLGELRRLPAAVLGKRIGAAALLAIARAYGEVPDPRSEFKFPEHFAQELELPAPVDTAAALLFAARRLSGALAGWLAARQAGIQACALQLLHRAAVATVIELRFAAPTRDAARFERVLRERLERVALAAPVTGLRLDATAIEALPGGSTALFDKASGGAADMAALVERLRARIGEDAVHGIARVAEHRPECATLRLPQGRKARSAARVARPLWLLAAPEALAERAGRPWRNGSLHLLAGPERIESGWWDEGEGMSAGKEIGDVRRDYFVALTADARWAWIFRDQRAAGGWYLHGWFA